MKILLFGREGQVGWELQRALAPLGEVVALGRQGADGLCGDLTNLAGIAATVRAVAPQVIVNAAAYTAVDRAESEPETAMRVNGDAPAALAMEAEHVGAWLVHYSSDYVFPGSGSAPWTEHDTPGPLSAYGQSKLAGDTAVQAACTRHLILRTSWVYGLHGANFPKTMLRLALSRDRLDVVDDQIGAPTGAELIADITAHMLRDIDRNPQDASAGGLYHLAAAGETSWWAYARFVLDRARREDLPLQVAPEQVRGIPSEAYAAPAPRPRNSRLNTERLQRRFGLRLPPWEHGVARLVDELIPTLKNTP